MCSTVGERCGGLVVTVLDSGLRGLGLIPPMEHCVVGQDTFLPQCPFHLSVSIGTKKLNAG